MAYDKQTWTAREGTNLKKYTKASETATTVILTNTPDSITVEGTPFSVDRMNHIEDGIESVHENTDALKITDPNVYYLPLSQTTRSWTAMTTLGSDVYASVYDGDIYKQTGGTGNFVALSQTSRNWHGMTTLGSDVYACVLNGDIYKQTGGTGNFVALSQTSRNWHGMTTLGPDVYAFVYNGDIYKQTGGTGDFVALSQTSRSWYGMTTLGSDVYACVYNGDIYKQSPTKALEVYSTAETLTNQTFLGYPVYRKVINFGALPSGTARKVAHGITGTFRIVFSQGWAHNPNGRRFVFPCPNVSEVYPYQGATSLAVDNSDIIVQSTPEMNAWTQSYITLEYIKADL